MELDGIGALTALRLVAICGDGGARTTSPRWRWPTSARIAWAMRAHGTRHQAPAV